MAKKWQCACEGRGQWRRRCFSNNAEVAKKRSGVQHNARPHCYGSSTETWPSAVGASLSDLMTKQDRADKSIPAYMNGNGAPQTGDWFYWWWCVKRAPRGCFYCLTAARLQNIFFSYSEIWPVGVEKGEGHTCGNKFNWHSTSLFSFPKTEPDMLKWNLTVLPPSIPHGW